MQKEAEYKQYKKPKENLPAFCIAFYLSESVR